ncbi:Glycosyltransferase involved in cell wall bisynthesis [Hathewaya proteolytica DSM 3090]|uniref:Glycosyltransferase involved in cell wall bisynthesis n=1 Tax=Hathewaya proteolytica DSM 3090 TaxID=1121331 RepID=A0A1M6Q2P3_9CLOT|nr:glycosyltransferase family 4 protein [Hathewaya proteolytica]SHK14397.1 Glycosyltransferase involved in cell wall bisynthesis [Hathewaya proteolytica DSM 3090]
MKIFFVGDYSNNTGPSIANKIIRRGLENNKNMLYSDAKNKIMRVLELIIKTMRADYVCLCSFSKSNIICIKIAKLFNKKVLYLMHGYSTYESKINNKAITKEKLKSINDFEKYIFKNVDRVFCVSMKFMEYMKKEEPEYADKFDYNFNGIDIEKIKSIVLTHNSNKKNNQIVSIGGGVRQKNNLMICEAIDKLNKEKKMNLKYIVIGQAGTDKEQICSYDFVTYYDKLTHEKVLYILSESYLYIQNSEFETFGLAIIEALICNCNLLISNNIGSMDIIETIENGDIIFNNKNNDEIAEKIEKLLIRANQSRLKKGLNIQQIHFKASAMSLVDKIYNS